MKTETPLLPTGVADAWFHLCAGGEVYVSRVCRGRDILKVLEDLIPMADQCADDLANPDYWHVVDGRCVSCSIPCGEDPDIAVSMIDDPDVRMPRQSDGRDWHTLTTLHRGSQLTELLAAASDDGIGVIARWVRRADGGWNVSAMDTESDGGMERVVQFHEGECVPQEPPI